MRKGLKFLHTVGACGLLGALAAYAVVLARAPQATARSYADLRATIDALCTYLLLPSLALALFTGLLAMAAHRPFLETRWAWLKAAIGLATFEGSLIVINGRARAAAGLAEDVAAGRAEANVLTDVIASEWGGLAVVGAIALANVALGVWRPRLGVR